MSTDTTDNVIIQADVSGNDFEARSTTHAGKHVQHVHLASPSDGSAITPASQSDSQEVRDRLPVSLVSGRLSVDGSAVTQPVSGPLTDAQLRAAAVPVSLPAGLATSDGQDDAYAQHVLSSTGIGAPSDAAAISGNGTIIALAKAIRDIAATAESSALAPRYSLANRGGARPATDDDGNLVTRATGLTDEGTWRCNFANSSLSVGIGSATLTNGSKAVAWSISDAIDIHAGDYIRLDADAESAWAQIDSLSSETAGTLVANYTGAGGTGATSRSLMRPFTGAGGSISVASGSLTITSGTTDNAVTGVSRLTDYAPLVFRARASISARNANQEIHIGLEENAATTRWFSRFVADGTTNTMMKCVTGRNPTGYPSASEIETTTFSLPGNITSSDMAEYRIELMAETVRFFVDGMLVGTHSRVIPSQYDEMVGHVETRNGVGAGACSVTVDYVTCKNHNKIETSLFSEEDRIVLSHGGTRQINYSVAGIIAINTDLLKFNSDPWRSFVVSVPSIGTTGVITVQYSLNDGATWTTASNCAAAGGPPTTTITASGSDRVFSVIPGAMYRVRLTTATTAGTTTVRVIMSLALAFLPLVSHPSNAPVNISQVNGTAAAANNGTVGGGVQRITIASDSTGVVGIRPDAAQGASSHSHLISAASTNATSVKASAGCISLLVISNANVAARYFKIYNKASAPTVGTDVPIMTALIPPTQTISINVGPHGLRCPTGIAFALTTGIAVADTGAVGADMSVHIGYT